MQKQIRVLLVEDDAQLGFMLADCLEMEGMEVKRCPDGNAGLDAFRRDPFDVCLLDVMLPQKDGFTLAREIRALNAHVPILFLTARSLKEDKLRGFALGADDYITKPF
ncbi:MAG TPA: response regulator, partial [Cytophagales bacterium]